MKKKRKPHNPFAHPVARALLANKTFSEGHKTSLALPIILSVDAFVTGKATETDWQNLALISNVCLVICENLEGDLEAKVKEAQKSLMKIRAGYRAGNPIEATESDLEQFKFLFELYEELVKTIAPITLVDALNEVNRRIKKGIFYKDGDL
jgi:hypothetical protein